MFGWQIAVCCFDKTGTLTSDNMVLEGLTGIGEAITGALQAVSEAGQDCLRVLAACQSLLMLDGELVGDPLERAAFAATGVGIDTSLSTDLNFTISKSWMAWRMYCCSGTQS